MLRPVVSADLVFCQSRRSLADIGALVDRAQREASITLVVEDTVSAPFGDALRLRATREGRGVRVTVVPRAAVADDLVLVRDVERRTSAAGLGDLAARCPIVLELSAEPDSERALVLEIAALVASVTLGPVLPAERDAIFGVRGARERARGS
jgi:hypothetical protein